MTKENRSGAITLRDVLRAVFLPDQVERVDRQIDRPVQKTVDQLPQAEPETRIDLDRLEPVSVTYESLTVERPRKQGNRLLVGSLTAAAVGLILLGQLLLVDRPQVGGAALLIASGGLLWIGVLIVYQKGILERGPRVTGSVAYQEADSDQDLFTELHLIFLGCGFIFSAAAYFFTADNLFTLAGTLTWVVSIACWLIGFAERSPRHLWDDSLTWVRELPDKARQWFTSTAKKEWPWIAALMVIIGLGVVFRFYKLDAIPNEMTSDHVEKLLDSYDVSQGIRHVFFTRNGGREAIQFYLVALASKLFGTGMSFLTLKLVSALEGLALIPVILLLGRELVDRETGYIGAGLVAISWWHTALSRLALRIVLTPLVFTLILVCLIRGIRSGRRKAWIWAGIWMGVGVYAYQALRMAPLVAGAALVCAVGGPLIQMIGARIKNDGAVAQKETIALRIAQKQLTNFVLAGMVALAFFVPMLRVWHDYPDQLWNRVINRTTASEVDIQGEPLAIFAENYQNALLMFNKQGDAAWISAVPGEPMLDRVTGVLFIVGVLAWLARLWQRRDPVDFFAVLAVLIMLLPSALAIAFPIENPSATRASGVIPIVFLWAAWPLALLIQQWGSKGNPATLKASATIGVVLVGAVIGWLNFRTYFVDFAESYRRAALNPSEVAAAVRETVGADGSLEGVWLEGWPFWHDYRAIGIEAGDIRFSNAILDATVLGEMIDTQPGYFSARPLVFIVHPSDIEALTLLDSTFEDGETRYYRSDIDGRDFILFVVPGD
ncbi:MAG: glycosyltransferase family 39 protein [Anaerolineae bacterium]|nr:glycosyltransferase family 39 protein [Anaerolineae bacterium]